MLADEMLNEPEQLQLALREHAILPGSGAEREGRQMF